MKRLVVIGGGVSGLAAASTAETLAGERGVELDITVLERDPVLGGKARSVRTGDWLVESGPLGYLDKEPEFRELIASAGLDSEVTPATEAARHRFVVSRGRVREISANPIRFAGAGILSVAGMLRAACEPLIRRRRVETDESVWEFAARRLGAQFADRLIHPMALGIFAGDSKALSLPAAFPAMAALEREHGSLIRGAVARRRSGAASRGGQLESFAGGVQSLPLALADRGRFEVRLRTCATAVARRPDGGWLVSSDGDGEALVADAVIAAGEPWAIAAVLAECAPRVADELAAIHCPPVCVAALGFGGDARTRIPNGFGVLIPRGEPIRTLGVTADSYLFDGRSPSGHVLVRAILGGTFDPGIAELGDDQIVAEVLGDLETLFGLRARPVFTSVTTWPRAIPQYELGHLDRVARIEAALDECPGVFLGGNGLYGTSFVKAALRGVSCGELAVDYLTR